MKNETAFKSSLKVYFESLTDVAYKVAVLT